MWLKKVIGDIFNYGAASSVSKYSSFIIAPIIFFSFESEEYAMYEKINILYILLGTLLRFAIPTGLSRYFYVRAGVFATSFLLLISSFIFFVAYG